MAALAAYTIADHELKAYTIRKDFRLLEEPRESFEYRELPAIP